MRGARERGMKFRGFLLSLMVILVVGSAGAQDSGRATTAHMLCNNFPPQKIESPEEGLEGFDVDLLRVAFAHSGVEVKIDYYPWARALHLASLGEADGLCSCSYAKERETVFHYSIPMGKVAIGIFSAPQSGAPARSLEAMRGQRVAVVRQYALRQDLAGLNVEIEQVDNETQGLSMMMLGRVEHFYAYRDPVLYMLQRSGRFPAPHFAETSVSPYYACFSKRRPQGRILLELFNKGLAELQKSGADKAIKRFYVD